MKLMELEVMIPDIEGWTIVKYISKNSQEVYAEHGDECYKPWNRTSATWSWQADDAEIGKANLCWQCKEPVPDSVVGLVALAEWR